MTLGVREQVADRSRFDILEAAATCFMERGYAAASIDEVARSLGATKGRIYHHYASKADLFADVFRTGMDMNYAAVAPYRETPGSALDRWRRVATAHTGQMIATQPFQRAMWLGVEMHLRGVTSGRQRETFNELIDYRARYGVIFRDLLAEGHAENAFHFEDLSMANQVMLMALSSPIFWYKKRASQSPADIDKIISQVVGLAECGLTGKKG